MLLSDLVDPARIGLSPLSISVVVYCTVGIATLEDTSQ
jgi:hypothetical protein